MKTSLPPGSLTSTTLASSSAVRHGQGELSSTSPYHLEGVCKTPFLLIRKASVFGSSPMEAMRSLKRSVSIVARRVHPFSMSGVSRTAMTNMREPPVTHEDVADVAPPHLRFVEPAPAPSSSSP